MKITWDDQKNKTNKKKHGLSFETASLVFDDSGFISIPDDSTNEERYKTIGMLKYSSIILVVHTHRVYKGNELIRIISAREATKHEKRFYYEVHKKG